MPLNVTLYAHPPTARVLLFAEFETVARTEYRHWLMVSVPGFEPQLDYRRVYDPDGHDKATHVLTGAGWVTWPGTAEHAHLALWTEMRHHLYAARDIQAIWLALTVATLTDKALWGGTESIAPRTQAGMLAHTVHQAAKRGDWGRISDAIGRSRPLPLGGARHGDPDGWSM